MCSYTVTFIYSCHVCLSQGGNLTRTLFAFATRLTSDLDVLCFGVATGSVTVAGTGGTAPYTYSMDGINFGSSGTCSGLAAGSYTITVKGKNGSSKTKGLTII